MSRAATDAIISQFLNLSTPQNIIKICQKAGYNMNLFNKLSKFENVKLAQLLQEKKNYRLFAKYIVCFSIILSIF